MQRPHPPVHRRLSVRLWVCYAHLVRKLPTICPPLGPSVAAAVCIPVFVVLGVSPWLLAVGAVVFALWPQWDSCLFGLWDFLMACAMIGLGGVAVVRLLAA